MKNKIFSIFVCMLMITTVAISAAGIITQKNKTDSNEVQDESVNIEVYRKADVIKEYEIMMTEQDTIIQDEPDNPQVSGIKTGYVSIPATAFLPYDNDADWQNGGNILYASGTVYAPVNLPHEAEVEMIEFYWRDEEPYRDVGAILLRSSMDWNEVEMADAWSSGSSGNGKSSDNTIDHPTIDNNLYTYYIMSAAYPQIGIYGVTIQYNYEIVTNSVDMAQSNEPQMNPK